METLGWLNNAALAWFLFAWFGYARFAHYRAKQKQNSLSTVMNALRKDWMREMIARDLRVADAALISNLERNVAFLASSSVLVLAGLLTAMAATNNIQALVAEIPFYEPTSNTILHFKMLVLVLIYVYAFFTFSWSMRQYGFATVVLGAAPPPEKIVWDKDTTEQYIRSASKVIDLAGHTYNSGLRSYYYSLAVLPWFINPWLFIASTTLTVIVLYGREFHSRPLQQLKNLPVKTP